MPTLAFWNTNGQSEPDKVVALARQADPDVLVLAESAIPLERLLTELNRGQTTLFFRDPGFSQRVTIVSRYLDRFVHPIRDASRVAIRHYLPPLGPSFLLVAVHLHSKLRKKTEDQALAAPRLARYVKQAETAVGHSRTVVLGDFNMNPFEHGVVAAEGLHAVMDRRIAGRRSRTVDDEEFHFFYNPMWSKFGDLGGRPAGTYYYDSGSDVNFYWNMLDQVLLRPDLTIGFQDDGLEIVTEIAGESLLNDLGRPDPNRGSDHLPIVLRLRESEE